MNDYSNAFTVIVISVACMAVTFFIGADVAEKAFTSRLTTEEVYEIMARDPEQYAEKVVKK